MKKIAIPYFIFLLLISCKENKLLRIEDIKEIEIGALKLHISALDTFIRKQGVDSYVAYIISHNNDTFHIEYGQSKVIYDLFDMPPKGLSLSSKESFQKQFGRLPNKDEAIFTKTPEEDNLQNIFDSNFYLYDTINGITAKIVEPKRVGNNGMTGIYVPELRDGNSFSIYAKNLDSVSHQKATAMFRTICYK